MYYLQSRYYDPNTGRFINADEIAYLFLSDNHMLLSLFTYCNNSPAVSYDPDGHSTLVIAGATIYISTKAIIALCTALLFVFIAIYRNQIQKMISQLLSNTKALAKALSTVVTNALKKSKLRRNVIHHIVARTATKASIARYYLTDRNHGNMSVETGLNKISLNERFHRHLHTNAYFVAVNGLMCIGNTKVGVIAALCIIRAVLWFVNKRFF